MNDPADRHSVRRIVLPSGRSIEVVRFGEGEAAPTCPLHVCLQCASELVQPVEWNEAGAARWELTLECPNCEFTHTGTFTQEEVEKLEEHLDEGLAEMVEDLRRLARANMSEEVARFAAALHAGLILPEDF